MEEFRNVLHSATNPEDPNFVTAAVACNVVDVNGKLIFSEAAGAQNGISDKPIPMTGDSLCWLGSMTKLMTTVAALQCVERGLIGLDDDVASVLPDLAALEVIDGTPNDEGTIKTKKRIAKITLRLLLSHQSGVAYELMSPEITKYLQARGITNIILDSTQISMRASPLAAEPGTASIYGAGLDWAGEIVARLNETTLEDYFKQNIWLPLSMKSTTLHPERNPELMQRVVTPVERNAEGGLISPAPFHVSLAAEKDCGGHGGWSTANDYIKLLHALLIGGGSILSKSSVDEIFKPQLLNPNALAHWVEGPLQPVLAPSIPRGAKVDHGLAGLIALEDFPQARPKGTLQWNGAPNLIWWIDRENGIAATSFMQINPTGDPKAGALNREFERAVYASTSQTGQ